MPEQYPARIDVETLGCSVPVSPGQEALLLRVTDAPGAHIPPHTDPGVGVWVVNQGTIGFTVRQGETLITRAGSAASERLGSGSEVILNVGDAASFGPDNVHTSRNAGDAPAVILIGGVDAERQPLVRPAGSAGASA
ncbi:MAG TPA: cupin domain-containing protein [Thermomicrobiales bacterium]|nr:cupin domain-containing protein [Thermomicrobiales bacterium]